MKQCSTDFSTDMEQKYVALLEYKKKCLEQEFQEIKEQYNKSSSQLGGIQNALAKNKMLLKRLFEGSYVKKTISCDSLTIKSRLFFSLAENQVFLEGRQEILQKDIEAHKVKLLPYEEKKRGLEVKEERLRNIILEKHKAKRAVEGIMDQSEREEFYCYENQ